MRKHILENKKVSEFLQNSQMSVSRSHNNRIMRHNHVHFDMLAFLRYTVCMQYAKMLKAYIV